MPAGSARPVRALTLALSGALALAACSSHHAPAPPKPQPAHPSPIPITAPPAALTLSAKEGPVGTRLTLTFANCPIIPGQDHLFWHPPGQLPPPPPPPSPRPTPIKSGKPAGKPSAPATAAPAPSPRPTRTMPVRPPVEVTFFRTDQGGTATFTIPPTKPGQGTFTKFCGGQALSPSQPFTVTK